MEEIEKLKKDKFDLLMALYKITEAEDPKDMFDIAEKMLSKHGIKGAPQPYELR